jgi:peroxiredoxin
VNIICLLKKSQRRLLVLLIFLIAPFLAFQAIGQSAPAQNIPDFTFYKMNGQSFSKKELTKSKRIVIVFFDATCEHCQHELKLMSDRFDEFKKAEFYLVSMDNVRGIQWFMNKYAPRMNGRPNVTLLTDLNRQFITRFTPVQYPALYVYGTNGHLIKYYGQNSKISDIIRTVNGK